MWLVAYSVSVKLFTLDSGMAHHGNGGGDCTQYAVRRREVVSNRRNAPNADGVGRAASALSPQLLREVAQDRDLRRAKKYFNPPD